MLRIVSPQCNVRNYSLDVLRYIKIMKLHNVLSSIDLFAGSL
jgi:hypothetical protein